MQRMTMSTPWQLKRAESSVLCKPSAYAAGGRSPCFRARDSYGDSSVRGQPRLALNSRDRGGD